ncbi:MAG: hypothetical protein ACOZBH_02295 [Patescibacteria group bacterium]
MLNADIVSAFDETAVGTKVTDREGFLNAALAAITGHDFAAERVPGQGFIHCPGAIPFVSAGVGLRTQDPADYVPRLYRGVVELFLRRSRAAEVKSCALVVYTREAYLADPDVLADAAETARVAKSDCTHVLVAILADAAPKAPLSPLRLVHNLAGGNREALGWTADEIREKAAESKAYHDKWCVVAD